MWDTYIPVEKVAKFLGVSKHTVYAYIKDGKFPSLRKADSLGFPGNPGYEVTWRDAYDVKAWRDEQKERRKKRDTKKTDDETKQLLTELHTNMVRQVEIIGKLLEKL